MNLLTGAKRSDSITRDRQTIKELKERKFALEYSLLTGQCAEPRFTKEAINHLNEKIAELEASIDRKQSKY